MAHQAQLANVKYRNWVKAGLGLKYVKEGLEPFCDDLVTQQHSGILKRIKLQNIIIAVSCGHCNVRILQPNHVRTRNKLCPLAQTNCNCQYPGGKVLCSNNVCGAIYDEIIKLHASTPPAPYWKNTDARQWCTEPWSIAKCFVNAPGYEQKTKASEFDCSGLLHVLINNKGFQQHIKCKISGTDVFSRVRKARNDIFHSHTMELEDTEVNGYIDDMIELLEDDKEIKHRPESKDAVKKLQELKQEDFIISTTDEAEIRRVAMATIIEKEEELKQTIVSSAHGIKTKATEGKRKLRKRCLAIKSDLEQKIKKIRKELAIKEDKSGKTLEKKRIDIEMELKGKQLETEENLGKKLEQKLQESKLQLESHRNVIERSMKITADTSNEEVINQKNADFQKKLVKLYERDVKKVTPLPRLHNKKRNVDDMFVPAWMTEDIKNKESGEWEEVKISMDKIFRNNEEPAKCIYVIGEAGSGKSTFCKMLVHFWCMAHSEQEGNSNEPDIVNEMKRFDFLFYVSLRYNSDCGCIEKMLEKSFHNEALGRILLKDSSKCLIVLDGLDEWNLEKKYITQFQTSGLPGRELDAGYTVITTTRQCKFDALSLGDSEVGKKIKLNGIDEDEMKNLTVKTVETLNDIYKKNRNAKECIIDFRRRNVSNISHTPLMLQQLVCLWFNDKLRGNSKCAIYGSIIDLFLEWKSLETSESQDPLYIIETLSRNTNVIHYLSYLANETLFDRNKESTLTFSSSKLIELSIPHDVIKSCLVSGILREERNVSLTENIQSTISFFHKSIQEYLAAVYITSQFKKMLSSKDERALIDVGKLCVDTYFGSCKTVVDILDKSNVFTMLCGLEPRLLTNVSEYIYNVSLVDKLIYKERIEIPKRFTSDHSQLTIDIQTCIFKCIEEVLTSPKIETVHSHVYIADLYVSHSTDLLRYCHNIILRNVLSVEIVDDPYRIRTLDKEDNKGFYLAVEHLTKCDQLKVIKLKNDDNMDTRHERICNEVATILAQNVNTLETVSLYNVNETMVSHLVQKFPQMRQLTSLLVNMYAYTRGNVPQNVFLSLSNFLNQATRLQYISLNINCEKLGTHMIDLSKHIQLQHVNLMYSSFCMVSCNTDNLETCELCITSIELMNQLCNSLCKAGKLKQLSLYRENCIMNNANEYRTLTENLINLPKSLVSLSALILSNFIFTDNIIAHPCDMKNLSEIVLNDVTMSMKTWCRFIDCLPALPQLVTVAIHFIYIRDEPFCSKIRHNEQVSNALQYVREKTKVFRVTCDRTYYFHFTTKKA